VNDDPPEYSEEEASAIAGNHLALARAVHEGEWKGRVVDSNLLCQMHAFLFEGVRSHAGRCRDRGRGSEYITFGAPRRRSVHRNDVRQQLEALCTRLRRELDTLRADVEAEGYEQGAVSLAVWAHVELIRIHPFEDGNGRTARTLLNVILVETGMGAVATEVPREEYLNALRVYDELGSVEALVDLYLVTIASTLP
jgi:fido (protein-threonine AMPylation protein)